MSEHELYYEGCRCGMFAAQDAVHCGCRGSGWFLSQLDTWHECPVHYTGQPHPEADDRGDVATLPAAEEAAAAEGNASDIPF